MRGERSSDCVWRLPLGALAAVAIAAAGCSDSPAGAATPPASGAPAPTLFIADQPGATRRATRAVVDAGTVWLLDANDDFVFGVVPASNWNADSGLSLAWAQVPGAAKYHVLARNAVTSPTTWQEILVVAAPDAKLNPVVVATGVKPWSVNLGTGGFPWSFGNRVELVVSSEDASGTTLANGLSEVLATADEFPGVLTGVAIDDPALPAPFTPHVERGATFTKAIRLSFSEPMLTGEPPALAAQSANLSIRRVVAYAWGTAAGTPSEAPPSAAEHAFVQLELTVKGVCTEVRIARSPGDVILVVRDATLFEVGAGTRLLFLDGASGARVGETTGVTGSDPALGRLVLGTPLAVSVPAGALACAISGGAAPVPRFVSEAGTLVTVSDATPFFVGEQVAIYHGAGPILDVRAIQGVDTVAGVLLLAEPLSVGHDSDSVVVPLNGLGGEVALRPSAELVLARDAAGGADTELFVTAPTSVMVGDTVLVDADGQLETTPDQAQAIVKQVKLAPGAGGTPSLVLDLPASMILIHGEARVIGMGDAFAVGGTRDTSAAAATPLDPHADQFSPDGLLY